MEPLVRECRICAMEKDEEGGSKLIRPCDCRGSVGYVHKNCIQRWHLKSKSDVCNTCGSTYNITKTTEIKHEVSKWVSDPYIFNRNHACILFTEVSGIITFTYTVSKYCQLPWWASLGIYWGIKSFLLVPHATSDEYIQSILTRVKGTRWGYPLVYSMIYLGLFINRPVTLFCDILGGYDFQVKKTGTTTINHIDIQDLDELEASRLP